MRDAALGVYVHWPFCLSKCPYCDFNSHVRERIDEARWRSALLAEIDHMAPRLAGRRIASIFFGGGTPSLMAPATVAAVIEDLALRWPVADDVEITLEANPTSVEAGRFAGFRSAGVNRVSLGVQALDDRALRFLGRGHDTAQARAALALAAKHFPRFSFDLIYARPGQSVASWTSELRDALTLAGDHLSVYQLTIEAGTAFAAAYARGDFVLPDEEQQGALFETTQLLLGEAGLAAYEISNHARRGSACRHNLVYWRYGDYLGLGPGAHGRLSFPEGKHALRNWRAPETWLKAVETLGQGTEEDTLLGDSERRDEMMMMGLRLEEGIPRARFRDELGREIETALQPARLRTLIEGGFLVLDDDGLRATQSGRQRLNAVLGELLA
ncbi:MAG TPA: radical SAM family heme chaperone HemW [Stellaceae bacterium]|nr:radical SAM family heme chaperone HemW [Stellaceae bacterium]